MSGVSPRIPIISTFDNKGIREAQSAFGRLGGVVRGAAKAAGAIAVAAGGAAAVLGGRAVAAASDLSESVNAVNVTFGDAAEGIHDLAAEAATAVGLSEREFNAFAVQFAGFTSQIAGAEGDIVGVTDELTTRIADFASVMNLDVPEAAQVFQSSLAGETEPIRRFGIDLSAAAVELFALENGLVSNASEMTEAIKVQARYGLLMQSTDKVAGDFANTSEGLANQQRILTAELDNAQAELGGYLLPAMETLANFATSTLVPALVGFIEHIGPKLQPKAQQFADAIAGMIDKAGELKNDLDELVATVQSRVGPVFQDTAEFITTFRDELELAAVSVGTALAAFVTVTKVTAGVNALATAITAVGTAVKLLVVGNPVGLVVAAIAALVAGVVIAYQKFEPFRAIVDQVWKAIQTAGEVVWTFIKGGWAALVEAFETAKPTLEGFLESFIATVGSVADWFQKNVLPTIQAGVEFFVTLFVTLYRSAKAQIELLVRVLSPVFDALRGLFTRFVELVGPPFRFFWENLKAIVGTAFRIVRETVESALAVIRGIFKTGTAFLKGDWRAAFEAIRDTAKQIVRNIFEALGLDVDRIVELVGGLPERIVNFARGLLGKLRDFGKDMVQRIVDGILSAPSKIIDAIMGLLPDWMKRAGGSILGGLGLGQAGPVGTVSPMLTPGTFTTSTGPMAGGGGREPVIVQLVVDGRVFFEQVVRPEMIRAQRRGLAVAP